MELNYRIDRERTGVTPFRQHAVERAEAYLRAHIHMPMRVSILCRIVGLSERGLRDAFYSVRGVSPKRWMLSERLHQVRRALREGDSAPITVTGVATDYGFFELGRFAVTYKQAFGESPSETLRSSTSRKSLGEARHTKGHDDVCTN